MILLRKEHAQSKGLPPASYAPIARALHALPEDDRKRLRNKFEIAYFVATEKISFKKYPKLCQLEAKHGVDIGATYTNEVAGRSFVHYMAEAKRCEVVDILGKADSFSLLLDGSTDKGIHDNELVLAVWCDPDGKDERIHTRMSFFKVIQPDSVSGSGLFQVLERALQSLGIHAIDDTQCRKLVGIAMDGAAANIAAGGLKGLVERKLTWIFWMRCLAYRMELAIKDALTGTVFDLIDEICITCTKSLQKSAESSRRSLMI